MMLDDQAPTAEQIIADLRRERDEALAREAAISEVLQVINSSPGDLAVVFQAMLDRAVRLCEATHGTLRTFNGETFHLVATAHGEALVLPDSGRGPSSLYRRFSDGEQIIHLADVLDSPEYQLNPGVRAGMDAVRARSWLGVSLRKEARLLGVIAILRHELRPFSDEQIALLKNFAAQAAIAMENARLITETRESLEQQTATAEVLQVINSSPADLTPVFDAILEKAHALCGAASGGLMMIEGNRYRAVAVHGDPSLAEYWRDLGWIPFPTGEDTLFGRLSRGEIVHYRDAMVDDGTLKSEQYHRLVELAAARSLVLVPLRKDRVLFGTITAFRKEAEPFSEKQIALLQNFAAQAVIAMENARLLTETREALEQQTATAEVLQVINSSPGDLAPVFEAILERAHTLCAAEFGALFTFDADEFRALATHGIPETVAAPMRQPFRHHPDNPMMWLARGDRFAHVPDLAEFAANASAEDVMARRSVDRVGIRTWLAIPLRKDGTLMGAISAFRREVRPFSDKEIALLENFAAQAVIAMENARLLTETREALEQQTATAEVLQVINSSPGDLAPVFDAMLDKALRICEAAYGVLNVFEGDIMSTVSARGEARIVDWLMSSAPRRPGPGTTMQRIVNGEHIVQINDVTDDAAYRDGNPSRRALVEIGGCRTMLSIALRKDERLLGAIIVYRQQVRPFTDKQIALLENFAAQAVIAMENARLLGELRQRTEEVAELNRGLEARVAEQVDELGRVGRLRRFLAPQLAELIVSRGDEKILESHRREIVVVFCDLRGYTAFTETAEPEEVLDFLREYHGALGPLVSQFEGTLDQFSGDGIMVFFNDPVPIPDPAERAVKMAIAMRETAGTLIAAWRRRGRVLGFGAGIAQGYATLGQIGFADRSGYTAIGTVCNLAARLCAEAKDGQILVGQRVAVAVEETIPLEELGELALKGLTQPVVAFNVPASEAGLDAAPPAGTA